MTTPENAPAAAAPPEGKTTAVLQAAAKALQADLLARFNSDTHAKKNNAFLGNALRAMNTISAKLDAQAASEISNLKSQI